ncbi:hypothetical protein [Catellatospora sichuanensis]|uniref:hypothetical protein n=1 Tax=Catellatospora sichuanensis TaxID=1969805 RepID=UPI001183DBFF|nr:hypothetical protein [Catellatospora sichuanensis]
MTINLRDVGLPVKRPGQNALFSLEPGDSAVARRPSPASVLFLENGGGKSVLMKLIFSVMLPGRRNVLGSSSTRVLEDFVLAADEAHVVLEWQHTQTGDRVVTAKASEWRGHVVSTDPSKLTELWYTFRPTEHFNLDTLPLTVDGRKVTLSSFRERLGVASREEPRLQAASVTSHGDWVAKLDDLGLDPELFKYQRRMNAGEGEAADAFAFKSDEAFVEFLLSAVTDEEDPRGLAEVVAGYAKKLADREGMLAERGFIAGALDRIAPLADAASDAAAAAQLAAGARREMEEFKAALAGRRGVDQVLLDEGNDQVAAIAETEAAADQDARRLGSVVLELRRLVAGLRLSNAQAAKTALEQHRAVARELVAEWEATGLLVRYHEAYGKAEANRTIVRAKKQSEMPAKDARDAAARRLARALSAMVEAADREQDALSRKAVLLGAQAVEAGAEAVQAAQAGARAETRKAAVDRSISTLSGVIKKAIDDGLAPDADHIESAAVTAAQTSEAADRQLKSVKQQQAEYAAKRAAAVTGQISAHAEWTRRDSTARQLTSNVASLAAERAGIANQERLAELLETDQIDLDNDGVTLSHRLQTAIDEVERQLTQLAMAEEKDLRVSAALGVGDLLPPSEPVVAALAILETEDIRAWAGWTYLAQLPPARRDSALRSIPHLIDGIVLNNPDDIGPAQRLLDEARLLPSCLIAVGTTAAMLQPDLPPPTGVAFCVPPNPAMFDAAAADIERRLLAEVREHRSAVVLELRARCSDDKALLDQISSWIRRFPAEAFGQLERDAQKAAMTAAEAHAAMEAAKEAAENAAAAEAQHQATIPLLETAAADLLARSRQLEALAEQARELPAWIEESRLEKLNLELAKREQEARSREAEQLREEARQVERHAGDARRSRDTFRDEIGELLGAGTVDLADPTPTEPLVQLRRRHQEARVAYLKVEVGADLLTELRQAEEAEAKASADADGLPVERRRRAEQLLLTSDGSDAAGRAAGVERARSEAEALNVRVEEAAREVGRLEIEFAGFVQQDRSLEPYGKPLDVAHGESLIAQASVDWDKARRALEMVRAGREALEKAVAGLQETLNAFASITDSLADIADTGREYTERFIGDVAQARALREQHRATLTEADRLQAETQRKVRANADELAQFAVDTQFETVTSPVRRLILSVNRETLPSYAADWERDLQPRLRILDDELSQINEHRNGIITRLHGMVTTALATLNTAQRLSRLPKELGDWGGQEFLRIRFTPLEAHLLQDRLGQVIDDTAQAVSQTSEKKQRDGLSILLRGVRAAIPKGVVVEMLKPDAVLRAERVRVASMSDVFSGGQLLTAAIILYCTMAALRANERGRTNLAHAGVLFLDNPIGRASAGYLLELQLAVASALGVQLIYTTGIFDTNALSAFPLIVRLRNDADLRAGMKYLSIDEEIRRVLDDNDDTADTDQITATRLFVRPREAGE